MTSQAAHQDSKAVQQFFSGTAADYSKLFHHRRTGSNFAFRERLVLATGMAAGSSGRLLDCACGSGEITAAILRSGRFTGATIADLSPRMLELAQQRLAADLKAPDMGRLEFKRADIFEFTAQPHTEQFDLILCLGLIAHTGRLDELLSGLGRLLSPGGKILLQSSLLDHWGMKMVRALTSRRYYRRHGYRISYFYHRDILRAAQAAKLDTVAMRRFTFGFPFGDRLWAGLNYFLEQRMQNWAKSHGSEALYLLQRASSK